MTTQRRLKIKARNKRKGGLVANTATLEDPDAQTETDVLVDSDFAFPESRRYAINNSEAATASFSRVVKHGSKADIARVREAIEENYPDFDFDAVPTANVTTNTLQSITANVTPMVRYETLENRAYTVVPMVMLTEGVHAGSNGPLYYPASELRKTPAVWNHKPLVVYHPTMNGKPISACEPAVINTRKVGLIMNTTYEEGKGGKPGRLKAEAWFETNRLKKVDTRVLNAITKKQMMEISTGLYTDNEEKSGSFKNEDYDSIARNYRPDHLAILPDQKGACSIADGGGLLRNGEQSFDDIRQQLQGLITDKCKPDTAAKAMYDSYTGTPWVQDVFPSFCVYQHGKKMMKQEYSVKNGVVALAGTPTEVRRTTTYKTLDGTVINTSNKETSMALTKKQMVGALIRNENTGWEESDREFLMEQDDDRLAKMMPAEAPEGTRNADEDGKGKNKKKGKGVQNASRTDDEDDVEDGNDDGVEDDKAGKRRTNNAEQPAPAANTAEMDPDEFIENHVPVGLRDVFKSGLTAHNTAKASLITTITANKRNRFTKENLETKSLEELQALAELAAPAPANNHRPAMYIGQGEVGVGQQPTANADTAEAPLPSPTLKFNNKKTA